MAPTYRIVILPEAGSDVSAIHDFITKDSPQNAIAVARRLIASIDSLRQSPQRCKIHVPSRIAERVVRAMSDPPFIIYYRILESESVVEVLTIRHGARRQPQRFKR
jgi:plasmid stabilization system protein ParE